MRSSAPSSRGCASSRRPAEELRRAKENLKGRVLLALESTGARMNRLGSELLAGAPLLRLDEVVERIDAVTLDDLAALVDELWAPGAPVGRRASAPTRRASRRRSSSRPACRRVAAPASIRVAVAGAAGRMGATVCGAVEARDDMELVARADPALGVTARRGAA